MNESRKSVPRNTVTPKTVTLVAALGRNLAIGLRGEMPWHLPAELKHFKETTLGKPVVMGRRTFEAIGRALPGRQNIVVTGNRTFRADGCQRAGSMREAVDLAAGDEVMVIGGGEVYRQALPFADRMVLTVIEAEPEADTFFPEWEESEWELLEKRRFEADERNPYGFEIREYRRS